MVNCLFSPVSAEITNRASGWPSPGESVTTRQSLSGHQVRYGGVTKVPARMWISASLRSGPPSGGITRNSVVPASDRPRRKATQRPSGDQAGL